MSEIHIPPTRPSMIVKMVGILNSGPKVRIIEYLSRAGEAGARDLADALGVKLSTVLEHLNSLIEAGLVKVVYRGARKRYALTSPKIVLEIDLALYASTYLGGTSTPIEAKAIQLFQRLREGGGVPATIGVRDAERLLGVDREEAMRIVDLINYQPRILSSYLGELILQYLSDVGEATMSRISRDLKVDIYWVALAIEGLVRSSRVRVKRGRISLP